MTAGTVPHQDDVEPSDAQVAAHRLRWWRELLYVAVFYAIYSWVRNLFGSQGTGEDIDASVAFEHARQIIDLERTLGLYFEASLQRWYLDLPAMGLIRVWNRSEEHTSELQSLMRISYAVFCLKKKKQLYYEYPTPDTLYTMKVYNYFITCTHK